MKKILYIASKDIIDCIGGAVKSSFNICSILAQEYDVTLAFYTVNGTIPKFDYLKISFVNLYTKYNYLSYSSSLNRFISENQQDLIIFSFPDLYANAHLDKKFSHIPRLLLFRSRPDYYFASQPGLYKKLKQQYTNTVSQILFSSYIQLLPDFIHKNQYIVIPNFVNTDVPQANPMIENKKIIFLSRIEKRKGIELLIESYSRIAKQFPDWRLDIYGQSQPIAYSCKLEHQIKTLGLEKQIFIKGITRNSSTTFPQYDFCVFPSFFEGFPNGLTEAMAAGLPAIGLKGCSGTNELIIDG